MSTHLMFVHALSPLHAGTGQSVGAVDLAIAREKATDLPYVPGSAIKGALRARSEDRGATGLTKSLFGPGTQKAREHRGGALFGDANLLMMPVRSISGTFAWVTSPYLLQRFARDLEDIGKAAPKSTLSFNALSKCAITTDSVLKVDGGVYFEDLDLTPEDGGVGIARAWANTIGEHLFPGDDRWQDLLGQRFCIVQDDVMTFLARHGTAVVARVALNDESKTVANLWHEESLPAESVLFSLIHVDPPSKVQETHDAPALSTHLRSLADTSIQLGGKATVGRGRCRLVLGGA